MVYREKVVLNCNVISGSQEDTISIIILFPAIENDIAPSKISLKMKKENRFAFVERLQHIPSI